MKTLAQYLAEYLEQEIIGTLLRGSQGIESIKEIIQEGLDAYQSTENCTITIAEQAQQQEDLLDVAREIVSDFNRYGEVLQVGDNGKYGTESAIGRLAAIVKQIEEG